VFNTYNKSLKQENLQLAVFTAFNILANYKFPLNEALGAKSNMIRLFRIKRYSLVSLFIVLFMWVYFAIASASNSDVRFDDGALNLNEMYWYEVILFISGLLLNFAFIFTAWFHSWRSGKKKFFLATLFIWPISFYYVLKFVAVDDNGT
jgi:hypothetical protein